MIESGKVPAAEEPNPQLTQPELLSEVALPSAQAKAAKAPAATFIFMTVVLDMLALGMIAPVLPRLVESFLHGDTSSAAKMLGLFGTTFAGMQFFFSPVLGSLSDRFGAAAGRAAFELRARDRLPADGMGPRHCHGCSSAALSAG